MKAGGRRASELEGERIASAQNACERSRAHDDSRCAVPDLLEIAATAGSEMLPSRQSLLLAWGRRYPNPLHNRVVSWQYPSRLNGMLPARALAAPS